MKTRIIAVVLSFSALLALVTTGCGPAPVTVVDPVEPTVEPVTEHAETETPAEATPAEPVLEQTVSPTAEPSEPAGDEEAEVTDGWPVFRDEERGFQIAYPPAWGFMDLPVDPGAGGPPTVVERMVIFYPQEWEERLTPGGEPDPTVVSYPALSVAITVGTMEAYRREYMELEASEQVEINGFTALREWDQREDFNMARTIFQHPADGEMRITLSDPMSGFSARLEEYPDIASLIPLVISTFRFTE